MEIIVATILIFGWFYLIHSNDKQTKSLEARQQLEKEQRDNIQKEHREFISRTLSEIIKSIASTKIQSDSQLLLLLEMIGNPRILSIFGLSETRVQLLIDIERASNSGGEIKLPTIYLTREDSISMGEVNLGGEIFLGNSPDNQLGNVRSWDDVLCKYRSPEAIKMLENLGLVTIQSELPSWNRILNGPVTVNATLTDEGRVALALTKRLQRVRTQYDDKSRSYIHINSDEFNGLRILLKIIAETLYENSRNNETKNLNEEGAQALSKEAIATYGLAFAKLFEHYAHIKMGAIADTTLFAKELETARDFNKRFSC